MKPKACRGHQNVMLWCEWSKANSGMYISLEFRGFYILQAHRVHQNVVYVPISGIFFKKIEEKIFQLKSLNHPTVSVALYTC